MIPLIIYHLKRKYLCKTEAELKEAWAPGDLGYGTRIPADMLILTIVLCYSVIAPVIIPFGVIYFALGWLVLRNQVTMNNLWQFHVHECLSFPSICFSCYRSMYAVFIVAFPSTSCELLISCLF